MAFNQSNRPPQAQPSRGQYQGQAYQHGWPNGGGQYYDNGYQQQEQRYGGRGFSQDAGQVQHGEDAYQQTSQSYNQPVDKHYDRQQPNQQYQYDPRSRSQGYVSDGRAEGRDDRRERPSREKHQVQQVDPKAKSKSRERILPAKESPVLVAWDNPFPVFNPKKKDATKKHSSLEKGMSKLNVSDQPLQHPQTSQSPRAGDDSRPHTSQGNRRPEPRLNSPTSSSPPPTSPVDRPPATRNDSIQMTPTQAKFSDTQGPSRPPLNPLTSGRPVASFQGDPSPRLQQSQRSMTSPDDVVTGTVKKKLQKSQSAHGNRQAPRNRRGSQEPYKYTPSPISPIAVQQDNGASASLREDPQKGFISPAMPNFDAISPSVNERSEDPLHAKTNNARPAYQKVLYQASVGAVPLPGSQSQPGFQEGSANAPDFAGFAFNLPGGSNNTSPVNQQLSQTGYQPSSPQSYESYNPVGDYQNQSRSYSGSEHNPPRSVSRQGYQQLPVTGHLEQYSNPNVEQSQFRNISDAQHYPPRVPNHSADRGHLYNYDREGSHPHQGSQGKSAGRYNQQPLHDAQRFYTDQRQYPTPINTRVGTLDTVQQQRSQTPNSAHPAPSRQYHSRDNSASLNPDALPAHPVPVRPGLMRQTSAPSASTGEGPRAIYPPPASNPGLTPTRSQEAKPAPVTAYDLNLLLQTIKNNPNDHKTALTLVKKLVEAASTLASDGGKADAKTRQKNRERYILDAHKYLKKLVHQGYPEAMFYLAECHGQGSLGLQVSPKEAFHLYTSAAKAGHAQAAYRVAVCCEMGNEEGGGTRRDPLKAMQWYRRAASMGDTPAMYKLGIILLKGLLGQPRNPRDALSWLKRAAEKADKDNPHALHELGMLFESASPSDSIVKDEHYSRQLYTQAAELGYKFSQFRLGSVYEYGMLGCPIDPRQSIAWYTRAAAQEEHQSELALSGWYLTGSDGVLQQSDTEAYLWARKAANSRLAKAEYAMGYFTESGIGCTANLDEAKKWYWRAAAQNFPKARQRLEDLKKGGGKINKARVSRSAFNKHNEGECSVM